MIGERTNPAVIAIDGPAAAGKGTMAQKLADAYGFAFLDTGALYRGVAWLMLKAGDNPADERAARETAQAFDVAKVDMAALRTPEVGEAASLVAAQPEVRKALLGYQRNFAAAPPNGAPGAVLDGRDIGTVVCPDADVKLFVTAAPEVRAQRRWRELVDKGAQVEFESVLGDVRARDARDANRADAPLKPAVDAVLLDTSELDIEAAFEAARRVIDRTLSTS